MQRRVLTITDRSREQFGDTYRFRVRGNGILFEQFLHRKEMNQEKVDAMNENFRNSLRYVKHYAGYPDSLASEKDMRQALEGLTQTSTGIGIKIRQDPLKEFAPFTL
jgi:hypothetical protein